MALHIYREFLMDLRTEGDAKFSRRVLTKIIDAQGTFPHGADDHRYNGIEDAWIRYVSMGGAAYRVIYIRKGSDIYLYRAGPHSVEDQLNAPADNSEMIPVLSASGELAAQMAAQDVPGVGTGSISAPLGKLLENNRPEFIRTKLLSRRFKRHREVYLVSPYLSTELFTVYSPLGKVLYDLLEEGTKLYLITRPPESLDQLKFFERLDADGFEVLFHDTLHAKLFLFDVDPSAFDDELTAQKHRLALIGSANLTVKGLAIGGSAAAAVTPNEELGYELPIEQFDQALNYVTYLSISGSDIPKQRVRLMRVKHHGRK